MMYQANMLHTRTHGGITCGMLSLLPSTVRCPRARQWISKQIVQPVFRGEPVTSDAQEKETEGETVWTFFTSLTRCQLCHLSKSCYCLTDMICPALYTTVLCPALYTTLLCPALYTKYFTLPPELLSTFQRYRIPFWNQIWLFTTTKLSQKTLTLIHGRCSREGNRAKVADD